MKTCLRLPLALGVVVAGLTSLVAAPEKLLVTRVFPNPGQIGVFIASADGSGERPLLAPADVDYDPVWSPDGASIVFTSERNGSADLYHVKPDGTGLEQLTNDPAYDDQAAFSPDGSQLVFVSSRQTGYSHLWLLDLRTRQVKQLTSGSEIGGDFRPAFSPDGQWIAFSSDRGSAMPFSHGRWEGLQPAALYVIKVDGTGLRRVTPEADFCGSPKWSRDGRNLLAYRMTAEQTLGSRRASPDPGHDTRLVSIDVATGASSDVPAGEGVKFNPSYVGATIGYVRKDTPGGTAGIYYADGRRGPKGDVRSASWSPDGTKVVFHRRLTAPPTTWKKTFSRLPDYELALTSILPSFHPSGERFVMTGRPRPGEIFGSSIAVAPSGTDRADEIFRDPKSNVLAPQWSPDGATIIFGVGNFDAFFNGFHGKFLKPGDRAEGGAQIATIRPDGRDFRVITTGPNNNGFPSMAPDGRRFVYRTFGTEGDGLRIMDLETKAVTRLTEGYDNFPLWSPAGDLIMFSRLAGGDYEIYTIHPDGTEVKRLTFAHGNDAHMGWSPDGSHIVFASSRLGFKDEGIYTDAPQPYGEIFVMRKDGSGLQQLTDTQWEEGTPAWQPAPGAAPKAVLAPSGKLRIAVYAGSPTSMVRTAGGEMRGLTVELGRELARKLGVPAEIMVFDRVAEVVQALTEGRADFTITNATPARAKDVDFTPPLLDLELGYLALPASPVKSLAQVDQPGIRIGVSQGSTSQGTLGRELKQARVVPAASLAAAAELLRKGELDAFATNKAVLYELADGLPGARVLEGRWGLEHLALAVPKGRATAAAYLREFTVSVQRDGLLHAAAERAGLRGSIEASP
jgi:TolB protein